MKYVKRQPPRPAPVHEFVLDEKEARYLRDIIGGLNAEHMSEILGMSIESLRQDKLIDLNHLLFDDLDDALNAIDKE